MTWLASPRLSEPCYLCSKGLELHLRSAELKLKLSLYVVGRCQGTEDLQQGILPLACPGSGGAPCFVACEVGRRWVEVGATTVRTVGWHAGDGAPSPSRAGLVLGCAV